MKYAAMKRRIVFAVVWCTLACAPVPSSLSPQGAAVYKANEVVVALGTLQHVAIELNKTCQTPTPPCQPILPEADTRIVVDAVTDALTTLKAGPDNWKAMASAALTRIDTRLDAAGKGRLSAYIQAVKTIAGL